MTKRPFNPPPILVAFMAAVVTAGGIYAYELASADHIPPAQSAVVSQVVPPPAHKGHAMMGGAYSSVFAPINARMHKAMDAPSTGNVDRDFAAGMIAHHEGAVEMAKLELKLGTDPEMRTLAKAIVETQTDEIGRMRVWTLTHHAETIRDQKR